MRPTLRGDRRHHERRVFARRAGRSPGFLARYSGKTPGKPCSCAMCGNPRRYLGEVTRREALAAWDDRHRDPDADTFHPNELPCAGAPECAICREASASGFDGYGCPVEDWQRDVVRPASGVAVKLTLHQERLTT